MIKTNNPIYDDFKSFYDKINNGVDDSDLIPEDEFRKLVLQDLAEIYKKERIIPPL